MFPRTPGHSGIALRSDRARQRTSCPYCASGDRDRSLGVKLEPAGAWVAHCFRCGWRAGSRGDAAGTGVQARQAVRAPAMDFARNDSGLARWRAIWRAASPWRGTPVETYLTARGCALPPADAVLRFAPDLLHWPTRRKLPAMLALATDAATGEPQTVHATYLRADGRGKADVQPAKMLAPGLPKKGAAIRLWPDAAVTHGLGIAEGIESALALAHAFTPVWACIDAGNLADFPPLRGIESLTIAADNDEAGQKAARACADRWLTAGREVRIVMPPEVGADIADVARAAA